MRGLALAAVLLLAAGCNQVAGAEPSGSPVRQELPSPEPSGAIGSPLEESPTPSGEASSEGPVKCGLPEGCGPSATLPPTDTQVGAATYCAPTPKYCHGWGEPAMLGAVRSYNKTGGHPYTARVCRVSTGACVRVRVVSFCACGIRRGLPTLIDLSPAAFKQLAPLSRGVLYDVTVTRVSGGGPVPTVPPTDTE